MVIANDTYFEQAAVVNSKWHVIAIDDAVFHCFTAKVLSMPLVILLQGRHLPDLSAPLIHRLHIRIPPLRLC